MEQLEKELRYKIVKILNILVWGCITLDVAFFVGFYFTDTLGTTVPRYVLKYLCLPFCVNMATYLTTKHINKSTKISHGTKNLACSSGGLPNKGGVSTTGCFKATVSARITNPKRYMKKIGLSAFCCIDGNPFLVERPQGGCATLGSVQSS